MLNTDRPISLVKEGNAHGVVISRLDTQEMRRIARNQLFKIEPKLKARIRITRIDKGALPPFRIAGVSVV